MNNRGFASDNNSGVSSEVFRKIAEVNEGHVVGYGDDRYTAEAKRILKEQFGAETSPFLVFTGTGANVLSLATILDSFHSVICANTAHIQVDECGAPEKFTGGKLLPVSTSDGKLSPELIKPYLKGFGFEHHSQPRIISISQPTEMGTVYSLEEIKTLADFAHSYDMLLQIDGARLANAAVSLDVSLKAMTTDQGVDVLSFGGTKNGLMAAEAVIFLKKGLDGNIKYFRKQGMQLSSKMRFIAAQFLAYFEDELWKRNAIHANAMAQKLYEQIKDIPEIHITQKVETNGIFAILPKKAISLLQEDYFFYVWNEEKGEVRWMTSFDTTEEDIAGFVARLKELLSAVG